MDHRRARVLIYGGSFDPPHTGHMRMLKAALRQIKPAQAYVVPAFHSPLKHPARADGAEREKMAALALEKGLTRRERRLVELSRFELARGCMTYTYETLRYFARQHPEAQLYFLLGSDSTLNFRKWKHTSEIRDLSRFLIGRRPRAPLPHAGLGLPPYEILPGVFPDISSTEVRARLLAGEQVGDWLPNAVRSRITRRGLYGLDIHKRLKSALPPPLFRHSLAVARMALELARRHGLDLENAVLAGLLHDCGQKMPAADMARYVRDNRLSVPLASEIARHQPSLFHAHIGEDVARREYGIETPAILCAIRKHTLGDLLMSPLDRLVFTADACSLDRRFPEAAAIRRLALQDLDAGFKETVRTKLTYVLRLDGWLHSSGVGVWNKLVGEG